MIAALYVDPRGPYPALPSCEAYDAFRDARTYLGPHPVVAHPPCGPWSALRHLCSRSEEAPLAFHALATVRAFGGVLEHPVNSRFWAAAGLPTPRPGGPPTAPDGYGGWSFEVQQVNWGHPARKRTWLYVVGCTPADLPPLPPARVPTHWASGRRKRSRNHGGSPVPPGIKVCSAAQRRRTPPAFARWLVALAERCRP